MEDREIELVEVNGVWQVHQTRQTRVPEREGPGVSILRAVLGVSALIFAPALVLGVALGLDDVYFAGRNEAAIHFAGIMVYCFGLGWLMTR